MSAPKMVLVTRQPLIYSFIVVAALISSWSKAGASTPAQSKAQSSPAAATESSSTAVKYDANSLHRLDFRVHGSSCPVCITGIKRRLQAAPGTVKAVIMIKAPYAGVIVYDASKTNSKTLFARGLVSTKDVTIGEMQDVQISKMPDLLVPHIGEQTSTP